MRKRKPRVYTDEQRRSIVAEYQAAPAGSKGLVAKRHRVSSSLVCYWVAGGFGEGGARAAEPEATYKPVLSTGAKPVSESIKAKVLRTVAALRRARTPSAVLVASKRFKISHHTIYRWLAAATREGDVGERVARANTALTRMADAQAELVPVPEGVPPVSPAGQIVAMLLRRLQDEAKVVLKSLRVRKGRCEVTYQATETFAL